MKNLLGNSCAKGCLIYVVALVAIVAATGLGLDGLKGRFNIEPPKGSLVSADGPSLPPGDGGGGGVLPTPTSALPPPVQERPQPLPTIAAIPTLAPGNSGPGITVEFTPVPGQGGVTISGEASAPFYIVQSGDTLWEIALRFGVDVETLRRINNLADNIIQPGQVLYLPQPQSQPQIQPLPTFALNMPNAQPGSGGVVQPTVIIPLMPNTGIIRR